MFKFLQKEVLKDFHDFHKYSVGDKVIIEWDGYDRLERIATIKSININFKDGELGNPHYYTHNNTVIYWFNEFSGWISEDKILNKLAN